MSEQTTVTAIVIVAALVLLTGGGAVVYNATRGLRNNNPGNIEDDGTTWEGMTGTDGPYVVFQSVEYGIRAMARILHNYIVVDGLPSTVTALISRWAPPSQNDTIAYINDVDNQLGLTPGNDAIDLMIDLPSLIAAIIRHENGIQPYTAATISRGIAMAA